MIIRICCYCAANLGTRLNSDTAAPDVVSHGICKPCAGLAFDQLEKRAAKMRKANKPPAPAGSASEILTLKFFADPIIDRKKRVWITPGTAGGYYIEVEGQGIGYAASMAEAVTKIESYIKHIKKKPPERAA